MPGSRLRLLVDEDSQARTLVRLLVAAGHDVLTADAADLNSAADREVLLRARGERRAVLTRNCSDFLDLHRQFPDHGGVLAVYQDADPGKCLGYPAIVRAVGNIESAGVAVAGEFHVLNAWSW